MARAYDRNATRWLARISQAANDRLVLVGGRLPTPLSQTFKCHTSSGVA
jgi:hypothetical protein